MEAVKRAGLDRSFTFHELRHTWASLTIMAGAPLIVVAQNLGHTDTRMVQTHYGHLADQFVLDSIRKNAPSFGIVPAGNVIPLGHQLRDSIKFAEPNQEPRTGTE